MDLTFQIDQSKLYIRTAVILKNKHGYIFHKHKEDYYYLAGGKVKMNESSAEAAYREIKEELGYDMKNVSPCAVLENFFVHKGIRVHELCFIYLCEDFAEINLPESFVSLDEIQIMEKDIRPSLVKEIISNPTKNLIHRISK